MDSYKVLAVLVIVVLASGCSQNSLPENAAEGYDQLVDKRDNGKYHVNYKVKMKSSSLPSQNINVNVDLYQFNGVQKIVGKTLSSYSSATKAVYRIDNNTVTCRESVGTISCDSGSDANLFSLILSPEFSSFNYSGTGKFAGRKCKMFAVTPNMSSINPSSYSSLDMKACVDRRQGFISYMQINISDSTGSVTLTIKAEAFDRNVGKENVKLPKALSVTTTCYSNPTVSITPLKPVNSAVLSVNGENRTVELGERFSEKKFDLSDSRVEDGSNDIKVYADGEKVEKNCYFTNYSVSDPYNPYSPSGAKESDVDLSQYSLIGDRIENGDFSEAEMTGNHEIDIEAWNHTDGETGYIRTRKNGIDGQSVGTGWKQNGFGDKASISQRVNLTGVEAVGLDVQGTSGNPHRSKIVLQVDGETQGYFIKRPQREETYRDLGVKLDGDFTGVHRLSINWIQIQGDNLGNSNIDNVRAYR
ncbi:MAG: hypothetical protein ABEK04_01430 [Candidatus Nanohalobium sp.]